MIRVIRTSLAYCTSDVESFSYVCVHFFFGWWWGLFREEYLSLALDFREILDNFVGA